MLRRPPPRRVPQHANPPPHPPPPRPQIRLRRCPHSCPRCRRPVGASRRRPLAGSADALALAQVALEAPRRSTASSRSSAPTRMPRRRLADEIAWFAPQLARRRVPGLGDAALRSFLAAPGPGVASGSRRSTASHAANATSCSSPRPTALYRLAPPSFLAALTFFLTQGERLDVERAARAAGARRLHARDAGRLARRVLVRGGLIDLFPMGSRAALPPRPLRRRDREHQDLRRRHAAHAVPGARACACCRPASFRWTTRDARASAAASAKSSKAIRRDRSCTRTSRHGIVPGGIEYYLPLFFDATATFVDYLPPRRGARDCTATSQARSRALLAGHRVALPAAARRQGAAAAAADAAVPAPGRVQRRDQGLRATSTVAPADRAGGAAARCAHSAPAFGAGRPARRRPARGAEAAWSRRSKAAC